MNNTVTLQGNLAKLEEATSKAGAQYAHVTLRTEDANGNPYDYPFLAFGETAERLKSFKENAKISVKGRIARSDYESEGGKKNTTFSIIGNKVEVAQDAGYKSAFTLSGFVVTKNESGKLELQKAESGKDYLKFALSVKRDVKIVEGEAVPEAKYDTYFLTAFGKTASEMAKYKKGDLVEISGNISVDSNGNVSPIARNGKLIREATAVTAPQNNEAEKNAAPTNEK